MSLDRLKITREAIMISLIQNFEADFLEWSVPNSLMHGDNWKDQSLTAFIAWCLGP